MPISFNDSNNPNEYLDLFKAEKQSLSTESGRTWSLFPSKFLPRKSTTFKVSLLVTTIFAALLVAGITVAAKGGQGWSKPATVLTALGGSAITFPGFFTILSSQDVSKKGKGSSKTTKRHSASLRGNVGLTPKNKLKGNRRNTI